MTNEKGRPNKYNKSLLPKIKIFGSASISNKDIAKLLDICENTFYNWLKEYPEIKETLLQSKNARIGKTHKNIVKIANGYHIDTEYIDKNGELKTYKEYVKPDLRANMYLSKNLGIDREVEHKIYCENEKLEYDKIEKWLDAKGLKTYEKFKMEKIKDENTFNNWIDKNNIIIDENNIDENIIKFKEYLKTINN